MDLYQGEEADYETLPITSMKPSVAASASACGPTAIFVAAASSTAVDPPAVVADPLHFLGSLEIHEISNAVIQ